MHIMKMLNVFYMIIWLVKNNTFFVFLTVLPTFLCQVLFTGNFLMNACYIISLFLFIRFPKTCSKFHFMVNKCEIVYTYMTLL